MSACARMLPAKRKSCRAKGHELPKRYRARDKYNRALEKFFTGAVENPSTTPEESDINEKGNTSSR